jgi:hypothetical protein
MPKPNTPSRVQAIRHALEEAGKPLSFDQLLAAARQSLPLDTQSLKAGLNALSTGYDPEARLIQRLAVDRYGCLTKS